MGMFWRRLSLTFIGILAIALALGIFYLTDFRESLRAFGWHKQHGDYVQLGEHRVKIPLWWWPEQTTENGSAVLVNSHPGLVSSTSGITINAIPARDVPETDDILSAAEQKMLLHMNERRNSITPEPATQVIIRSPTAAFYCIKEVLNDGEFTLHCSAAGLSYQIEGSGFEKWEKETESIISSWD